MLASWLYNAAIAGAFVALLRWLGRRPTALRAIAVVAVAFSLQFGLVAVYGLAHYSPGRFVGSTEFFAMLRLLSYALFLQLPLLLWVVASRTRETSVSLARSLQGGAVLIALVATDAFLVEPRWLEVTKVRVESERLKQSLTLALIADLQFVELDRFTKRVLLSVVEQQPDLILLAGDYSDHFTASEHRASRRELNRFLREIGFGAPLGVFAVQGDVDDGPWEDAFDRLDVHTFRETEKLDVGPVTIVGLSLVDSRRTDLEIKEAETFQIVLGHAPDFALGEIDAELLLAGHTHGGQVRLPGLGPLLTLSRVPREWAAGRTELSRGRTLLVSKGIGMEREYAPPLRFLCRPQLVYVELAPKDSLRRSPMKEATSQ